MPFDTKDSFQRAVAAFNRAVIDGVEPDRRAKTG
jgi:hypothetical protein